MKALLIMSKEDYLTKGNNPKYELSHNSKIRKKAYELLKEKECNFTTEGVFAVDADYMNSYRDLDVNNVKDETVIGVIIDFDKLPEEIVLFNDYYDILHREMKISPEDFIKENVVKKIYSSTMHSNCIMDSSIFNFKHRVIDMNYDPFEEEQV